MSNEHRIGNKGAEGACKCVCDCKADISEFRSFHVYEESAIAGSFRCFMKEEGERNHEAYTASMFSIMIIIPMAVSVSIAKVKRGSHGYAFGE